MQSLLLAFLCACLLCGALAGEVRVNNIICKYHLLNSYVTWWYIYYSVSRRSQGEI
jgi:hypothetical protein